MRTFVALVFAFTAAAMVSHQAAAQSRFKDWATIEHPRHGFSIAYPAKVFTPRDGANAEDGQILVSEDGKAKLLIGAFINTDEQTLADYRSYLIEQNYPGAAIDYAPVRKKWFVLSGIRNDTVFYERVSFTCGGRLINSWALLYPVQDRRFYDRVVEAVARTYSPGAGAAGDCDYADEIDTEPAEKPKPNDAH